MSITRHGAQGNKGPGGQSLPFSRAVEADGWLYVSGQVPMVNGQLVAGDIVTQSRQAILNLLAVLQEAGYGPQDVVRCGVWLDDPRDFYSFNSVFREHFTRTHRHDPASSPAWLSIAKWKSSVWPTRNLALDAVCWSNDSLLPIMFYHRVPLSRL
jgi:enamine deaminase RidA (YjgF/YER057c/UK114 family)